MSSSDDPFEARPTGELLATDALLDRIGARNPTPDDLDDPVVAALALMAAEIDLDPVPEEQTRAALARALPDETSSPAPDAGASAGADEPRGVVIDLRDIDPLLPAGRDELRGPRRRQRSSMPVAAPVAMAPPRSLPRMPPPGGPGGSRRPEGRRQRKLRPMVAVAVAVAAIVLGSGASAAITGGRSVNPLDGVQQVVAQLTGGRTQDQAAAFEKALKYLTRAEAAVYAGDPETARSELAGVTPALLARLNDDDRAVINAGIKRIKAYLPRSQHAAQPSKRPGGQGLPSLG